MKVLCEELLDEFRRAMACEYCRRPLRHRAHPHHVWKRGMGGGGRLDVRFNLVSLGGPFDCNCHREADEGRIPRKKLVALVARRERTTPGRVVAAIYRMRRTYT